MTLIAIVGATGTGKSDFALDLAHAFADAGRVAEVVNADAMQLYRGMDIGTAKLPPDARRGVPHHLLDVLDVTDEASVAAYQPAARSAIDDIIARGGVALLVGGSGLYVSSVIHDFRFPGADAAIRASVDDGLARQRRMHLRYYVPGRDETTERDVDPIRLLFSDGKGYLEAYCYRAEEVRLFRLDRITGAAVLDEEASPPEGLGLHDLSKDLFQPDPEDPMAVLDLEPPARWVAEYYPTEGQEELGNGRLRVRLRFSDPGWLQRLVLRLGGNATLQQPDDVAAAVRARAEAALAQYAVV